VRALVSTVLVALALAVALTRPAAGAGSHKILVLPVDGTADATTRARLTVQISRLAGGLAGQVATAQATFEETALAVGCAPQAASCSDEVMAALGVDELVWATADKDGGQTKLIVRRVASGLPARAISTVITASDSTERVDAVLAPLFSVPAEPPPSPIGVTSPWAIARERTPGPRLPSLIAPPAAEAIDDPHERRLGIALAVGGGVSVVLGIVLWSSYASLQTTIDSHPTSTRADFDDLLDLEGRANTYAILGDVLVVAGLAGGGLGAYHLYRDHQRSQFAITPAPLAHGAGLTLTILGGL
jgi:hypothetical protein